MHKWSITKPNNPYWRKCSKCGMIRIQWAGSIEFPVDPKRPEYTFKRGNKIVYNEDDILLRGTPKCNRLKPRSLNPSDPKTCIRSQPDAMITP